MLDELNELREILATCGVHETLRILNSRTPHRFTGVYRFDGAMLRNEHLVDQFNPEIRRGVDTPMQFAYCSLLQEAHENLEFADARRDTRVDHKTGFPVISYCGVLLQNANGTPFGTLCHYDTKRCQKRMSDVPLLEALAPAIFRALEVR